MTRTTVKVKTGVKLKGSVVVNSRLHGVVYDDRNDIAPEFALALALDVAVGNQTLQSAYISQFALPSAIIVLVKSQGAVITGIPVNLNAFSDNLTQATHTTAVTYVASDATAKQYTFDTLELWSVVNNNLFLRIATVSLPSPFTKLPEDVIQVTWVQTIISPTPLCNFTGYVSSQCGTCVSTYQSDLPTFVNSQCQTSYFNLIWAVLIVPNVCTIFNSQQYPLSCPLNTVCQGIAVTKNLPNVLPNGIIQYIFVDNNFNLIQTVGTSPQIALEVVQGPQDVYLALNFYVTLNVQPAYVILVTFYFTGYVLAIVPITGLIIQGVANEVGILITIPYGVTTRQQLTVPQT